MVPRNDLGHKKGQNGKIGFSPIFRLFVQCTLWYKIGQKDEGAPICMKFGINIVETHINVGPIQKMVWLMRVAHEQGVPPRQPTRS